MSCCMWRRYGEGVKEPQLWEFDGAEPRTRWMKWRVRRVGWRWWRPPQWLQTAAEVDCWAELYWEQIDSVDLGAFWKIHQGWRCELVAHHRAHSQCCHCTPRGPRTDHAWKLQLQNYHQEGSSAARVFQQWKRWYSPAERPRNRAHHRPCGELICNEGLSLLHSETCFRNMGKDMGRLVCSSWHVVVWHAVSFAKKKTYPGAATVGLCTSCAPCNWLGWSWLFIGRSAMAFCDAKRADAAANRWLVCKTRKKNWRVRASKRDGQ